MIRKNKIAIVSIAKNIEFSFSRDFEIVTNSFADFNVLKWVIVESNSTDDSMEVLQKYSSEHSFVHLKIIADKNPEKPRTFHLASARNECLDILKESKILDEVDYVVVYDLNNLNKSLTRESVNSCFQRSDWSAVTANQDGPYYDIFALRHQHWNNGDCWQMYKYLLNLNPKRFKFIWDSALWNAVYSKMIRIDKKSEWIRVESAFGGVAIYKSEAIRDARYVGVTEYGLEVCEHVFLNKSIGQKGGSIFINPKFINFKLTDHSKRRKYFVYYNTKYYVVTYVRKFLDRVKFW